MVMWMGNSETMEHKTFRADPELLDEVSTMAEKYGMRDSQLLRLLVKNGVQRIERDGLDGFVIDD